MGEQNQIKNWKKAPDVLYYLVKVKVAQSCPTVCDSMNYTVQGILQARILERVGFPFSRGSFEPRSPALQADSLPAEPQRKSLLLSIFNLINKI